MTDQTEALEGGSYEVIRTRLLESAKVLTEKADALNKRRKTTFGGTELEVVGNERVRTENNCVPRDILNVGGRLLLGFNVFLGLRTETKIADVFSLHRFEKTPEGGFDLSEVPADTIPGLLVVPQFRREFEELHKYYKDAKLLMVRDLGPKLLAVFQVGGTLDDIKVFRWALDADRDPTYIDNRGDKDHVWPKPFDFEWTQTTRESHVSGRHPHVSILDEIFVETVGGDLTVKVENNTEDGMGIYREPVEDPRQALDDAEIWYAKLGSLILLRVLPFRETVWRHLVFNIRTKDVRRIDRVGESCIQLPEDHGIIFPGGYYLQTGETKIFDTEADLRFIRSIKSPNGEDVLYVFYHRLDGRYLLLPYNLIRKEVPNPITCHGFTLFDDGKLVVFRSVSNEPTRVHPMQIWQTPFTSDEFAAAAPKDGSYLTKVGNSDLVRGISDAYSITRLIYNEQPTRLTYEDLIKNTTRMLDSYYWLDSAEVGDIRSTLEEIKTNSDLVVGEFEKVQILQKQAREALREAEERQKAIIRELRPEDYSKVSEFLHAMAALRKQRGHIITVREVRYIDLAALQKLEEQAVEQFDRVSKHCVKFLLGGDALGPLVQQIEELLKKVGETKKATEVVPHQTELETLSEGLNLLSETVAGLEVDDPTQRTQILESISEVFGHLNRVRATLVSHKKSLLSKEGKAEFAAQFKLLGQSVTSAIAMADSPEKCDESLSRLMVQLEELEGRFSEFDEFLGELAGKRDEIYEAFEGKKQQLLDERQRRAQNIASAADRILESVNRRAKSFKEDDELNAYFAADAMVLKLRQLVEQLTALGDSVKADDIDARLKSAKRDATRNLRDKQDLYEEGESVIKLGAHKFNVNTQQFELTMVPRDGAMFLHLTGTDFYQKIDDADFEATREYWEQSLISETGEVYRGEYLAHCMMRDLELRSLIGLGEKELIEIIRTYTADRYEEGYERGLHDADTAKILEKLLAVRATAGLLRFAPEPRAWGCLFWACFDDDRKKAIWHRRARSLGRLRRSFAHARAEEALAAELAQSIGKFLTERGIDHQPSAIKISGQYLIEELIADHPSFTTSAEAMKLREALLSHVAIEGGRRLFEEDLRELEKNLPERLSVALAYLEAMVDSDPRVKELRPALIEAAVVLVTEKLPRTESSALTQVMVEGLLGNHPRITDRTMHLRLDEFLGRLSDFSDSRVPGYRAFRELRTQLLDRQRVALRLDEFKPRVLTSFVRNRLINDVYLPLIGNNLAKQIGSAGEKKRTDLMGLLLLVSPPGYGKTTLMEYMASRLGMVFMKINGPSLGHDVTSLDPNEAPNATARQEVDKVNLAFEMANNVMLYLDDIQHTNSEFLQKFISLCDGSRRIEGVWKGKTRTYDLRGKKFAVVMAGNPYTESGEKFQIPDMLANRADTYNLGDILQGKDEVFALSYLENSLTSNSVLGPVAARSLDDVHRFIRLAMGREVAQTEFSHSYSSVETEELVAVLKRLFKVRDVLLAVNMQYIASASQDERFRTEPTFKLQGSYRNMNKIAEKVVSAMNDDELESLITDHYNSESQTLTTGAEHNLLKLAEMRGRMSEEEKKRWEQIKKDFRRVQVTGGADQDPVVRVSNTIGSLGDHLDQIQMRIAEAIAKTDTPKDDQSWIGDHLAKLDEAVAKLATPSQMRVEVQNALPADLPAAMAKQAQALEQALLPLVRSSTQNLEEVRGLARPLLELIELMKLNALNGSNNGHHLRASTEAGDPPQPKRTKSAKKRPATTE